jgi:hypothetical protein
VTAGGRVSELIAFPDVVRTGLDRPTSLEFIGDTAYVVTLTGEVWEIDDVPASGGGAR